MMILDCVELPYPPSVNHYGNRASTKTRENCTRPQEVREGASIHRGYGAIGKAKKCRNRASRSVADGIFPDRKVRDLDNLLKGVLDGLVAAGVMLDDSQIHDLRVVNSGEIVTGGKIVVSVWEILE